MKFLSPKEANAQLNPRSVKALLHRNMRGWGAPHGTEYLHASDLTNFNHPFCPREFALLDILPGKRKGMWVDTALRATFDMGSAAERLLRENWIGSAAIGTWECWGCGYTTQPLIPKPPKCPSKYCKITHWRYVESRVYSHKYGVSGGIDLIVNFGMGKYHIVEVKTLDKDAFSDLKAPLAEHRQRTSLYLFCAEDSGPPWTRLLDTKQATILYMARSHGFRDATLKKKYHINDHISPFKEFVIKQDISDLKPELELAKKFKKWREKRVLPKGICVSPMDKRAKGCSRRKECFSGDYPAESLLNK